MTDNRNRRIRWWNIMRAIEYLRNSPIWQLNGDTNYDDDTPVTASVKYLKNAEARGVPYKQALLDWRAMERTYRQRIAESLYTAFPGQNHPDIIMRDFDQTYDGIEYDFDPMHPEGTADDPIAYRALTLPNGYQIEPRLSRRTMFEQKQSSDSQESTTAFRPIQVVNMDDRTDQENTQSLNQRRRRSSIQQNQQQHETTSFTWRCEMAVDNDVKQLPQFENGAKFLTYGGRVVENNEMTGNDQQNEQDSKMTYGCLWLVPRGPNILEFSMIGTGIPAKNQSLQNFARQLCNENHAQGTGARNDKKLRLRRPSWVTETRTDHKKRVPVRCPVPPGIVFYGVVPAPPPPPTVSTNKDQITPLRLCAKLVSSADDCTAGQMGPADQMKYTVSECVEQDSSTGTSQTEVAQQTIFEEREYQCIGQWTEPQEHFSPVAGEKPVMLTYTYLKRLSPVSKEGAQYECFVGTPIPNDEGLDPETTTTILLTEAGTNTKCSRFQDPYRSGMKLVGTKIKKEGACKGSAQPVQDTTGGSWYSLKPQSISPSIPGAENGRGAWYAAPPVPVIAAQGPTTMPPILTGRHTGGNGATFTARHNEQNRRPQSANLPPKTNHSFRTIADKRIVILAVILFTAHRFFN
ncbi:uncharacterized protein LOC100574652 [Acyrthosiphon pisum]|uniref:Uncharacterized protein n=1 Tax=Acyrthosiphon pisum TaxID=7029 RepID=A0A8R2JM19_ACYPI|nr:uncharacterized protein LOC100574652 [Acyrthosiphon pisum]